MSFKNFGNGTEISQKWEGAEIYGAKISEYSYSEREKSGIKVRIG